MVHLLEALGAISIMALIALNVYVVTSKETPAFLKWDAMSYIFANGNSNSGSGSGFESITNDEYYATTGCDASVTDNYCIGKDGRKYLNSEYRR